MKFLSNVDLDNLVAIIFIGSIAIVALVQHVETNQIATSVVSGLIGYIARGYMNNGHQSK